MQLSRQVNKRRTKSCLNVDISLSHVSLIRHTNKETRQLQPTTNKMTAVQKMFTHLGLHIVAYACGASSVMIGTALAGLYYRSPLEIQCPTLHRETATLKKRSHTWMLKKIKEARREDEENPRDTAPQIRTHEPEGLAPEASVFDHFTKLAGLDSFNHRLTEDDLLSATWKTTCGRADSAAADFKGDPKAWAIMVTSPRDAGVNLRGAHLTKANLSANLAGANFDIRTTNPWG
ncbi:hypothetical protein PROFUN_07811 [Planoprotostelium fungivorum]|uniref:Uncharacterized protein n=1 Tax=Planoprotostelium fungivorum TaxID=1890364 RepID=A0A2P6MX49_9EUKA|nr:hypothetical protein PROFUN_07811 [Planoprotostelium fungivorum]